MNNIPEPSKSENESLLKNQFQVMRELIYANTNLLERLESKVGEIDDFIPPPHMANDRYEQPTVTAYLHNINMDLGDMNNRLEAVIIHLENVI